MKSSAEADPPPPTSEQIRDGIDSGSTGEKVPYPDPAAAPLGSDEEAAGTPIPPEARRLEWAYQQQAALRRQRPGRRWPCRAAVLAPSAAVAALLLFGLLLALG